MKTANLLGELRAICLAFEDVEERLSHGEPAWFYRGKKLFVMFADQHHDDRVAFCCAAPPNAQEALIASEPKKFFRPPYVGHRGWVGVYLDIEVKWDEIQDIVQEAYNVVAGKK